jgi:hypothetical protein
MNRLDRTDKTNVKPESVPNSETSKEGRHVERSLLHLKTELLPPRWHTIRAFEEKPDQCLANTLLWSQKVETLPDRTSDQKIAPGPVLDNKSSR